MELGLFTFGDVGRDPATGRGVAPEERFRNLMEEIALADEVGLDVFGLGEHHRPDYAVSAPAMLLAAAAPQTRRIRLTSAVTVLSSDDPVRVFQQFATLDALSGGRAEIMAGRGSFIESFPLFGFDLADYDSLFAEKLALLLAVNEAERVTWPGGRHTPRIDGRGVYPRPVQAELPVWLAIGGTPESAVRAGELGLPMALAIIGGAPARFAPILDLYRRSWSVAGHAGAPRSSINVHGFVADTTEAAAEAFYAPQASVMNRIGRERGWPPGTRADYDRARGPGGALFVGDPEAVAEKILAARAALGFDRFLIQMAIGLVDHRALMRAIELFGTRVAPVVRAAAGLSRAG